MTETPRTDALAEVLYNDSCAEAAEGNAPGVYSNHTSPEEAYGQAMDLARQLERELAAALKAKEEAERKLNTPELVDFVQGVVLEAAHQVERWGTAHDRAKRPADWFWLVGYLAGKALHACASDNHEKALHHCISTAAALCNWHAAIKGTDNAMCPGKSDLQVAIEDKFPAIDEAMKK